MSSSQRPPLQPWYGRRVTVPVISATGGVGNSTVAAALASALTVCVGDVAVLDTAPRGSSPWPNWLVQPPGGGTPLLAWQRQQQGAAPFPPDVVQRAASRFAGVGRVLVFTDTAPWQSQVTECDVRPGWWNGVPDAYRGVVVDGPSHLLTELFRMSAGGGPSVLHEWLGQTGDVVPVLVTGWSSDAVTAVSACLSLLESTGVQASRVVIAAVSQSDGPPPPGVLNVLTALAGRGIPVVNLPFDPAFRADGARSVSRAQEGFQVAVTDLVNAVLARTGAPPASSPPAQPQPVPPPFPQQMGPPPLPPMQQGYPPQQGQPAPSAWTGSYPAGPPQPAYPPSAWAPAVYPPPVPQQGYPPQPPYGAPPQAGFGGFLAAPAPPRADPPPPAPGPAPPPQVPVTPVPPTSDGSPLPVAPSPWRSALAADQPPLTSTPSEATPGPAPAAPAGAGEEAAATQVIDRVGAQSVDEDS